MLFEGHVGVEVGLGRSEVGVTEPERDDGGVDTGMEERHRAAVAQDVLFDVAANAGSVETTAKMSAAALTGPAVSVRSFIGTLRWSVREG